MPFAPPFLAAPTQNDMVYGLLDDIKDFTAHFNLGRLNAAANFVKTEAALDSNAPRMATQRANDPAGVQRNRDAIAYLRKHQRYKSTLEPGRHDTRRKCKGILAFQLLEKQLPVHFIITRMQTIKAAQKLSYATNLREQDKEIDITHAELRWVYRNRYNGDVQRLVQFWDGQTPCVPPWIGGNDAERGAWGEYTGHLNQKTLLSSGLANINL
jgi:hypothetical protein